MAFSLLSANLSIGEVDFVTNTDFHSLGCLMLLEHCVPDFEVLKGDSAGDIIDHDCAMGVLHVVGD